MVLVNAKTGLPMSEFRTYVRPVYNPRLTAFCTSLTGIRQEDVSGAPLWIDALQKGTGWLHSTLSRFRMQRYAFVTCGDWDLQTMLPNQCDVTSATVPAGFKRWINIKHLFHRTTGKPIQELLGMLHELQLPHEGRHHSGLDDCRNIAKILHALLCGGAVVDEDSYSVSDFGFYHSRRRGKGNGKAKKAGKWA